MSSYSSPRSQRELDEAKVYSRMRQQQKAAERRRKKMEENREQRILKLMGDILTMMKNLQEQINLIVEIQSHTREGFETLHKIALSDIGASKTGEGEDEDTY